MVALAAAEGPASDVVTMAATTAMSPSPVSPSAQIRLGEWADNGAVIGGVILSERPDEGNIRGQGSSGP